MDLLVGAWKNLDPQAAIRGYALNRAVKSAPALLRRALRLRFGAMRYRVSGDGFSNRRT
jgi:hypothetical protein